MTDVRFLLHTHLPNTKPLILAQATALHIFDRIINVSAEGFLEVIVDQIATIPSFCFALSQAYLNKKGQSGDKDDN